MKILITGATGFVGINTTKALSEKNDIRILVRNADKAKKLFYDSVEIFEGDILHYESAANAVRGVDAVIHIAGLIKSFDKNNLYAVNRIGSRNVASAMKNEGVNNVVYLSSLAARGPDESDIPVSHYGYSKLHGEYEFFRYLYDADLKILRPPIIYGPYEKEFYRLFKMAKIGILPVLDNKLFSFVYVEDLVCAIEKLVFFKAKKPKRYYIADGGRYSWSEVADYMFETVGKRGMKFKLSESFANVIAYATYFMKDNAPFSLDKIHEIKASGWTCGYGELKKDVGFEPKYTMKEGFEKTLKWYVENGKL